MTVEAPYRDVSVVKVHPHHRAVSTDGRCLRVDRLRRAGPGGGQIAAGPAWLATDRIRHGLAARDSGLPLFSAISEHCFGAQHVTAMRGIGEVLQRFWQPQADLPIRGRR